MSVRLAHLINMHNNIMFMYFTVFRCGQTRSWLAEGVVSRRVEESFTPPSSSVLWRLQLTGQHTTYVVCLQAGTTL